LRVAVPLVEILTVLAFLFVLGVLIFVHELGHFLMARRIGVRVLTFSLGFGPKLVGFRRGDTEYCISAVPLGGYVKMAGENPDDARTGASDEFLSKSKWQRFQVLIMGPVMNLVLAVVVMAAVLYQGAPAPIFVQQPAIVATVSDSSALKAAGLQRGDQIVAVDGEPTPTWEDFANALSTKSKRQVALQVDRQGKRVDLTFVPVGQGKYDVIILAGLGIEAFAHPQVISLQRDAPAHEAGPRPRDPVVAADGRRDVTRNELIELIRAHEGKPISLEMKRDGQTLQVGVTPRKIWDIVMIVAILEPETRTIEPTPIQALKMSVDQNWTWAK